ncbi:MAG: ribosome silencing factor [Acidimicrobiia bacterium]|nr:ribosome silencing factor [Acidimicrobiia bacterium]
MSGFDPARLPIVAARAAAAKTDRPTVVLDVGEVLSICGWFVITSGGSDRQVRAIADAVEEAVTEAGGPKPLRIEGLDEASWVLIDYGDVIVHVMDDESRDFYDLERLWRDVPVVDWADGDERRAR